MITKIAEGIVLQKFIFEDENIVKLLTKGGSVLTLKAKGLDSLMSKNNRALQVFNRVEVEYFTSHTSKSNTGRLKTANTLKEYIVEASDLVYARMEVIRNIILNQTNNSILTFNILEILINLLEIESLKFQHILSLIIVTLRQNGYTPVIDRCAKCGSNQNIKAFEVYEGGLICDNHEESNKYELPTETLMKLIEINSLKNPIECRDLDFEPTEVTKLISMYKMFMENQLAINLFMIDKI